MCKIQYLINEFKEYINEFKPHRTVVFVQAELKELDSSCVCERVLKHIQQITHAE